MSSDMPIMKIAKQGGSVDSAEKDLVFTSNRSCVMELFSDYIDITTDGSGFGNAEFTHGLGYRPANLCFVRDPLDTRNWYPASDGYMALGTSVDTNKLYLAIDYKEESSVYRVKYSIFGNQQEDGTGTGKENVTGKIRVAKSGYDASTEKDARNMRFFSGKNTLKIDEYLSGSCTLIVDDFIKTITIPHDLGYVPYAMVLNDTSYGYATGQMLPSVIGNPTSSFYVNSSNLVIIVEDYISGGSPTFTMTFKYKIFRDKIA
jgi:hypothetical protein